LQNYRRFLVCTSLRGVAAVIALLCAVSDPADARCSSNANWAYDNIDRVLLLRCEPITPAYPCFRITASTNFFSLKIEPEPHPPLDGPVNVLAIRECGRTFALRSFDLEDGFNIKWDGLLQRVQALLLDADWEQTSSTPDYSEMSQWRQASKTPALLDLPLSPDGSH
jgi:hypothetical protein